MSTFKTISKTTPLRKENPLPPINSMLLPTNAHGSGSLLNTQQHCFQGKGEREEPVQLRCLEKCCPRIQFSQQFCPRLYFYVGKRSFFVLNTRPVWFPWERGGRPILCCSYRWSRWLGHTKSCWSSSLARRSELKSLSLLLCSCTDQVHRGR